VTFFDRLNSVWLKGVLQRQQHKRAQSIKVGRVALLRGRLPAPKLHNRIARQLNPIHPQIFRKQVVSNREFRARAPTARNL
jgi:hypothetical protein